MRVKLSVIVPAYNESLYIETCLHSITTECSKLNIDLELIVIDNGSIDNTAILAQKFTNQVYTIPRNSVSHARNFGVKKSSHEILAFIDGDVEITPKWSQFILDNYQNFINQPSFLSGYQCIVPENGSWIEQHWFSNLKDQLLGGANIITSRNAYDIINGFDESLKTGEDYDYCIRSINSEINYIPNRKLEAIHLGFPHTLANFLKREYWHGEGDFKSFRSFIHSAVAILSLIYLIISLAAIISLIFGEVKISLILAFSITTLNMAVTVKRFKKCPLKTVFFNSFLNFGYFIARAFSLFKAINNRNNKY